MAPAGVAIVGAGQQDGAVTSLATIQASPAQLAV